MNYKTSKLFSTIVAVMISCVAMAQRDTVWMKGGDVVVCSIIAYESSSGVLRVSIEQSKSKIMLEEISKYSWNGIAISGNLDWLSLPCSELPFLGKDKNGYPAFNHSVEYMGHDSKKVFYAFKEGIQRYWGEDKSLSYSIDEKRSQITITSTIATETVNDFGPTSAVQIGTYTTIEFSSNRVVYNTRITEITYVGGTDDPKEVLIDKYLKKSGKPKKSSFFICELCNNIVANQYSSTKLMLDEVFKRAEQIEQLLVFRSDFEEYLKTGNSHFLEGIWSADVSLPDGGVFNQAFELAIYKRGKEFVIMPLTFDYPTFDHSIKYLRPTAEPSLFLLTAKFSGSEYESSGRFLLNTPATAQFSLQVPEADLMGFLKMKQLKYVGNRVIDYSLVKTVIQSSSSEKQIESGVALGSGFALTPSGYVATNNHVVEGGKRYFVKGLDGKMDKKYVAELVITDAERDLAILKIVDKDFVTIGDVPYNILEDDVRTGTKVYSIGFPKPNVFNRKLIATNGIISSNEDEDRYQMTVPLTFGNSGGPIFTEKGELAGVSVSGVHDLEMLAATYSIKSKFILRLLENKTKFNRDMGVGQKTLVEDQIESYKKYVYLIEVYAE